MQVYRPVFWEARAATMAAIRVVMGSPSGRSSTARTAKEVIVLQHRGWGPFISAQIATAKERGQIITLDGLMAIKRGG